MIILLHTDCFACAECSTPLSDGVPCHKGGDGKPYCTPCHRRRRGEVCSACDGVLNGTVIAALGKRYHEECFHCSMCQKVLNVTAAPCYQGHVDRKLYCESCAPAWIKEEEDGGKAKTVMMMNQMTSTDPSSSAGTSATLGTSSGWSPGYKPGVAQSITRSSQQQQQQRAGTSTAAAGTVSVESATLATPVALLHSCMAQRRPHERPLSRRTLVLRDSAADRDSGFYTHAGVHHYSVRCGAAELSPLVLGGRSILDATLRETEPWVVESTSR